MARSRHAEAEISTAADTVLREYEATEPLDEESLPRRAREVIEQEINADETRLGLEYQADGRARIRATQHVGIVTLPDGPAIEIRPKVPQTDLLGLLQYARGIQARTIEETTQITAGRTFIDALATLFEAELESVLTRGLHKDYRRVSESESHLRGRLNVQQQLQRQGPKPTEFECTYNELTVDTIVNRAVLYATTLLQQFVRDRGLNKTLQRHQQRLRRRVELVPVRPVQLERVELNRLTAYYEDLFRLTKLVIQSIFVDDLRAADRSSFALLVNMNSVFEAVVERAVTEVFADRRGWTVAGQASSQKLVSDGPRSITIRPDILVSDSELGDRLVGDAKWKLDDPESRSREPSTSDIYQLVAYQVAHETPGVLFYPEQGGRLESVYDVHQLEPLTLVEIPVWGEDGAKLETVIRDRVAEQLPRLSEPKKSGTGDAYTDSRS
jgi:5-methylcytosine-specific restriction enzyme subunit McrC